MLTRSEFLVVMAILAVILLLGAGAMLIAGSVARKKGKSAVRFCSIVSAVVCILISAAAFMCNLGWCRVVCAWLLIPFWYPLALVIITIITSKYIPHSKSLAAWQIISEITFLTSSLILPDFGDIGDSYMFFSQITPVPINDEIFLIASVVLFVISLVSMIMQIVLAVKTHRKINPKQVVVPVMYNPAMPSPVVQNPVVPNPAMQYPVMQNPTVNNPSAYNPAINNEQEPKQPE